jgi:hypothetical protein
MTDTPEDPAPQGSEEATSAQLPAPQTQTAEELAARTEQPPALDLDEREARISTHRRAAGPSLTETGTGGDRDGSGSPPDTTPPTDPVQGPQE